MILDPKSIPLLDHHIINMLPLLHRLPTPIRGLGHEIKCSGALAVRLGGSRARGVVKEEGAGLTRHGCGDVEGEDAAGACVDLGAGREDFLVHVLRHLLDGGWENVGAVHISGAGTEGLVGGLWSIGAWRVVDG